MYPPTTPRGTTLRTYFQRWKALEDLCKEVRPTEATPRPCHYCPSAILEGIPFHKTTWVWDPSMSCWTIAGP